MAEDKLAVEDELKKKRAALHDLSMELQNKEMHLRHLQQAVEKEQVCL